MSAAIERIQRLCCVLSGLLASTAALAAPDWSLNLSTADMEQAEGLYQQYCALCHGKDREGYQADHAPSLRSQSLLSTAYPRFLFATIGYGRANTAMEGYSTEMGGPLERNDIRLLAKWLLQSEGIEPVTLGNEVITGDTQRGGELYAAQCAECHGADGQGITAPSLGDPALLANASDAFLRHAIVNGRDNTPMVAFGGQLPESDINSLVAYLRSQASGWSPQPPKLRPAPSVDDYVLNPEGEEPQFTLRDDRYVPAAEVVQALEEGKRFILLDTRPASAWQRSHIPGAVPMPYYRDKERAGANLPNDGTWIVAYCACPHAASDFVVNNLKALGYKNLAVIDEGILVWTAMGLPLIAGEQLD
ncbi:MAG: c-type cytochrome [Pseudomonadota bacterium]